VVTARHERQRTRVIAGAIAAAAAAAAMGCKMQDEGNSAPEAASPAPSGHVRFVHAPAGDVPPIVRDAMTREAADKRRVVVYVGATWCEPCQRFHKAAEHGDLDSTFPSLTLVEFEQDVDGDRLKAAGYVSRLIPLFALPNADGTSSGRQAEGGIKGDGAVGVIVPRLKQLLEPRG
jgi:thiol-disulfide isomerase/thioredoxin